MVNCKIMEEVINNDDINVEKIKPILDHIDEVRKHLNNLITELSIRAIKHDVSKLKEPERDLFIDSLHKLKNLSYGSKKYYDTLKEITPAIDHHYNVNRHHPEHFENGINGMNIVDIMEMLVDWYASINVYF